MRISLILLAIVFLSGNAYAWPPTYGAEFEFTSKTLLASKNTDDVGPAEKNGAKKLIEKVREKCLKEDCKIKEVRGKHGSGYAVKVELKDGWWFQIDIDPSCIEIQTKPATKAELEKLTPTINELIFNSAKETGFFPDFKTGAGHFNIGAISSFANDPQSFLKYFVDYANHPELAAGAMSGDFINAPPLSALSVEQRTALNEIIAETEAGQYKNIPRLSDQLLARVYNKTFEPDLVGFHYQALSIKRLPSIAIWQLDAPFEIRAMPPQTKAEDFTLMAELFEKRVEYLNSADAPPLHYINTDKYIYNNEELASRFYVYIKEVGGDWDHYKPLLQPDIRNFAPDVFLTGKANWKSKKYVEAIEKHLRFVPTSKWLRDRITNALKEPGALESENGKRILKKINLLAEESNSLIAKNSFLNLLTDLKITNSCDKLYSTMGEKLR